MKKAMILAAGKGSRLGDLGLSIPKALLELGDICMLQHVIGRLVSVGVESIIINLHHLGEEIEQYVVARNSFGIDIQFSWEDQLLETGGGLKKVAEFFSDVDEFILHNCDVYSDFDISTMIEAHRSSNALATLAVNQRDTSRYLLFNENDNLVGWDNISTGESSCVTEASNLKRLAFCCVHVISKDFFKYLEQESESSFSIISPYLNAAGAGESVKAFSIEGTNWFDVGTPSKLVAIENFLNSRVNIV